MEPFRLRRWRTSPGRLFTCGRPGRSKWKDSPRVPEEIVDQWVEKLPGPNTVIVSLLGRKKDGKSEFSFYPFYGVLDNPLERKDRPSFQEWLDQRHGQQQVEVRQYPTIDFCPIPPDTLATVAKEIAELIASSKTVVLIDSGGEMRTGQVCRHMRLAEDFP